MAGSCLSQASWRAVAGPAKVRDNGILKALATWERLVHSGDPAACADGLMDIRKLADKLQRDKAVASNKAVTGFLDDLLRDVARAGAEAAKAAKEDEKRKASELRSPGVKQSAAADQRADDVEEDTDIATSLLAAIARIRSGAGKVSLQYVACVASPAYGLVMAKRIGPRHKEALRAITGSARFLPVGRCVLEEGKLTFVSESVMAGLAKNLQKAIKVHTGKSLPVRARDDAGTAVLDGETDRDDAEEVTFPALASQTMSSAPASAAPRAARPAAGRRRSPGDTPIKPDKFTLKDDEVARKRGAELRRKWEAEKKTRPSPFEDKDGDGIVDHLIDDAAERAKAFAAHGLGQAAAPFEADTPETEFLADLKSGVDHVAQVFDHVDKALKFWQQNGRWVGIGQQISDLASISSSLSENLGKVSKSIDKVQQVVALTQGLQELSANWSSFDPSNPSTHAAFITSMEKFGRKAEPFVDWAKETLVGYAIEGSEMAAKGLLVIQMVTFYAKAGLGLLEAGLKAERLYLDRLKKTTDAIEKGTYGMAPPPPQLPPPPAAPPGWSSRRQQHNAAVADDNASLLRTISNKRQAEIEELEDRFAATEFTATYRRNRASLVEYIWTHGLDKPAFANTDDSEIAHQAARTRQASYWAGLLTENAKYDKDDRRSVKRSPGKDEVAEEIRKLRVANPKCPFFVEMFQQERDRYVTTELGKAHPDGKQPSRSSVP